MQRERLLEVLRYVEANALSAKLVERAEQWRWGSLWARQCGTESLRGILSDWPVDRPGNWLGRVNEPITAKEMARLAVSERREQPYGEDAWVSQTVKRLGLEHTVRREGRPSGKQQDQQTRK